MREEGGQGFAAGILYLGTLEEKQTGGVGRVWGRGSKFSFGRAG